jgi:hypothetical protein
MPELKSMIIFNKTTSDEIKLLLSLLITGFILLFFYLFLNKLEILWTSYSFILLGLIICIINNFTQKNYEMIVSCILIIFIVCFNIYITVSYKNKISQNQVSSSYYSLSLSNILLLFLQLYIISTNIFISNHTFGMLQLTQIAFLITLSLIINITQMIILQSFSTDG